MYKNGDISSGKLTVCELEKHHFEWVNQLVLWPYSIAMLVYQRVTIDRVIQTRNRAIWWFP